VLLPERGDYLPREKQNWDVVEVFDRDRYISRDTDMEPYYTQAERLYQVHGEHGVDPTDPRRRRARTTPSRRSPTSRASSR
jgi:hypothetical protein